MKKIISLMLALIMALSLVSCGEPKVEEPEFDVATLTNQELTYSLEELETLAAQDLLMNSFEAPALYKYFDNMDLGVAFGVGQIKDYNTDPVTQGILKHFNVYVLGNECKPAYIHRGEGQFYWDDVDRFVEFGKINDVTLRGHTLLWHSQVPDWWFKADPNDTRSVRECYDQGALATREQLTERLTTFITEYVTRYKDDIEVWDLCNEVLNADSIRTVRDDSYWAEIIGDVDGNGFKDDYVEIAANAARAADEDAVLIINDFNMEWQ
ncbi:MAG: endo-1,4-beta-xylanase, partial [Oscillospiraceae bacterium]|nr:endo-1,4-beta-xylanase [Oscillospiraceae bacterium]